MTTLDLKPRQLYQMFLQLQKEFETREPDVIYPSCLLLVHNVVVRHVEGSIVIYSIPYSEFVTQARGHSVFLFDRFLFDRFTFSCFLGSKDRLLREYFSKHDITVLNV